jgi:hypothetical protein
MSEAAQASLALSRSENERRVASPKRASADIATEVCIGRKTASREVRQGRLTDRSNQNTSCG